MAKTVTLTTTANIAGDGDIYISSFTQPSNTNAPPPWSAQLAAGNNTIIMPTGFTFQGIHAKPPVSSANAKIIKGVTGDTGITGWTNQCVTLPVSASNIVINSVGSETIEIIPF